METGSSSSSSSAPIPGQQSEKLPTYTTVGSVYNPHTTAPLQPPARRGRALRWPASVPADLTSFQKAVLSGLPNRASSPPTTASTLKHYSPLQQNQERAINPLSTSFDQNRSLSRSSKEMSPVVMHPSSFPATFRLSDKDETRPDEEAFADDEIKDDEGEELARMSNYSVKTLTSLAQIPNPHQKLAQRALDKARESFKASSDVSRPITPILLRQGFDGAGILPPTTNIFRDGKDRTSARLRCNYTTSSNRSSVLSNGPGAPQPLTAGPPGQRQYKASTLEGTFRALHASSQKSLPSEIDEAHFDINPSSLISFGTQPLVKFPPTQPQTPHRQSKPLSEADGLGSSKSPTRNSVVPTNRTRNETKYHDTETLEYLKQYYPLGGPPKYNLDIPTPVSSATRSLRIPYLPLLPDERERRDIRHRTAFYAGTLDVFRKFDDRYNDFRSQVRDHQLGLSDSSQRAANIQAELDAAFNTTELGKPYDISIEAVSKLSAHEAAEPLLGMAFSTLARYWNNNQLSDMPTNFERAD